MIHPLTPTGVEHAFQQISTLNTTVIHPLTPTGVEHEECGLSSPAVTTRDPSANAHPALSTFNVAATL